MIAEMLSTKIKTTALSNKYLFLYFLSKLQLLKSQLLKLQYYSY